MSWETETIKRIGWMLMVFIPYTIIAQTIDERWGYTWKKYYKKQ